MKKFFTLIRQGNIEEVKSILKRKPEVINSISTPPPKKDIGQSPLQVAVKTGRFEIAYLLIEYGADINFMEEEADGVTWRAPILQDAIRSVFGSLCYGNEKKSDDGIKLMRYFLERGADPNKVDSHGDNAWEIAVHEAGKIILNPGAYSHVQDYTKKRFKEVLDLLLEFGVDNQSWLDQYGASYSPYCRTNREMYVNDFVPQEDKVCEINVRGKTYKHVFKGDEDDTLEMRKIIREYYKK